MKRLILFFTVLIFYSCDNTNKAPANIIPKDEMIDVLTDVHLADGYLNTMTADSLRRYTAYLYKSIFLKHKTDSVQFSKSLAFYSRNPKEMTIMYDTIRDRLNAELVILKKVDSLKLAKTTDSLMKAKKADSLKLVKKTDSLNLAKKKIKKK